MLVHNSLRFAPIVNLFRADCQALFTDVIELCLMRFTFLTVVFELKPDEKIVLELGKILAIIVDNEDDIAAFANYTADDAGGAPAAAEAPATPAPEPAAAAAPTPAVVALALVLALSLAACGCSLGPALCVC